MGTVMPLLLLETFMLESKKGNQKDFEKRR